MKQKKDTNVLIFSWAVLLLSVMGLLTSQTSSAEMSEITGKVFNAFPSLATISGTISVGGSTEIGNDGITFLAIIPPITAGSPGSEAQHNNDGGSTLYSINIGPSTNVDVDFCISADVPLTHSNDIDTIPLTNYFWANGTTATGAGEPIIANANALTTSYVADTRQLTPNSDNYYRFWLTVDAGQKAGDYDNFINFEVVESNYPSIATCVV